jgi:hypothetical protein
MSGTGGAGAPERPGGGRAGGSERARVPAPGGDPGRRGRPRRGPEPADGGPAGPERGRWATIGGSLGRLGAVRGDSATAARTPFVVLVVTLLAGGLVSLLLLNSAVNRDSFQLDKLQKQTTGYTDEQQQLQQEVDGYSAPGELERRAQQLGMVPGGNPAFLNPDGTLRGIPSAATGTPAPPPTTPSVLPTTPPATVPAAPPATAATPTSPAVPTTAPTP